MSRNWGYLFEDLYNKDYRSLGSILGPPIYRKCQVGLEPFRVRGLGFKTIALQP